MGDALSSEDGLTVVELLITMAVALLIFAATVTIFSTASRSQDAASSRAAQLAQGRAGLSRMLREIRVATWSVNRPVAVSATRISFHAPVRSATGTTERRVVYDCDVNPTANRCVRAEAAADTAVPASFTTCPASYTCTFGIVPDVVQGFPIFSGTNDAGAAATSNPTHVDVRLRIGVISDKRAGRRNVEGLTQPIDLQDGTDLRNAPVATG